MSIIQCVPIIEAENIIYTNYEPQKKFRRTPMPHPEGNYSRVNKILKKLAFMASEVWPGNTLEVTMQLSMGGNYMLFFESRMPEGYSHLGNFLTLSAYESLHFLTNASLHEEKLHDVTHNLIVLIEESEEWKTIEFNRYLMKSLPDKIIDKKIQKI